MSNQIVDLRFRVGQIEAHLAAATSKIRGLLVGSAQTRSIRWMIRPLTLTTLVLALFSAAGLSLPAFAQTLNLQPGKYETTSEISMPGSPLKPTPVQGVACITTQDLNLKDFAKKLPTAPGDECTVSDSQLTGNKGTFTRTCKGSKGTVTQRVTVTFASDSYNGVMDMKNDSGRTWTIKWTGKRVGECSQ